MANGQPFLVFEIEPDAEPGPPVRVPGKVPARYRMSQIGCFFADSGEAACRMAARSLNRLGYFVAVATIAPELDFQPTNKTQTLPPFLAQKEQAENPPAD